MMPEKVKKKGKEKKEKERKSGLVIVITPSTTSFLN